jgi:mRNA-decapping enzyme subunit 2
LLTYTHVLEEVASWLVLKMSDIVLEEGMNGPNGAAGATDLYANYTYQDALDDVHTRFVLNLPESELLSADRMFVQLEQAWWFYEDFICDAHPELNLPRYTHMKPFAKELFLFSEVLPDISQFSAMWQEYVEYKRKISNYGCILLSSDFQRMVLCQVYNGRSFTLPSGKINQGEDGVDAAARETYEETGFDPSCKNGLTSEWNISAPHKITWNTEFSPKDKLVFQEDDNGKRRTCYVVPNVPEDFPFAPVCRKEVSNIVWCELDNLPPTFAVLPFMKSLRLWIKKKLNIAPDNSNVNSRDTSAPKSRNNKSRERNKMTTPQRKHNSRTRVVQRDDDDVVAAGLAQKGDVSGWSEEEMFRVNEQLLGRKIDYDGNPHVFAEEGLSKTDPHAYRIVGGSLLNSQHTTTSYASSGGESVEAFASPPDRSRLQPLFRKDTVDSSATSVDGFTPFFSKDGATPWGDIVPASVESNASTPTIVDVPRILKNQKTHSKSKKEKKNQSTVPVSTEDKIGGFPEDMIPTDAQITAKSQATKLASSTQPTPKLASLLSKFQAQYENDMEYIRQWVANLPKPEPTRYGGVFTLDIDAIMAQAEIDVPALRAKK